MFASAPNFLAQAGQAELTGEVRDANDAGIVAARVILTETATGRVAETNADESGLYFLPIKNPEFIASNLVQMVLTNWCGKA